MPSRNRHFCSREPFRHDDKLTLRRVEGPFSSINPTRAHFDHAELCPRSAAATPHESNDDARLKRRARRVDYTAPAKSVRFLWRPRDNRKGRHPLLVQPAFKGEDAPFLTPRRTSDPREVVKNVVRTFTLFPVWDISWLGFFAWLPLVAPGTEFPGESYYGGGITAFIGAIVFFEVGSILLVFEAINANNTGCFGWAVEQLLEQGNGTCKVKLVATRDDCRHHHQNKCNLVGKPKSSPSAVFSQISRSAEPARHWQWFPSRHDLRIHYLHELGFLAGLAQLFGATVFGISGITALPGVIDHLTPQWRLNAAYWIPQVIGGSGFIASSTLYMLETQEKWWKPAPHLLGWHVALWNLIGAFGFTLCGALGMAHGSPGAQYQASLATFW
ncbi:uncharacterized protein MAM_01099 [Metarhizium album ARSEF 1941]|uniref:Integral membrane protein n=1 Tax=Metarhizium album (strain ARSEF 1941) TaxID=1081103 RepID=A0A0B2X8J4_METAS|nr:uncharacterized protein MAM_01099 [Metarhizium album ARSEF 1941]KHO02098.1 integral membrane protein [Metarhizium album ARSEF 1941]